MKTCTLLRLATLAILILFWGAHEALAQNASNQGMVSSDLVTAATDTADLKIIATVDKDTVMVGDSLNFTICVVNAGPDTAVAVFVTDFLPSILDFVSANPEQGSCQELMPNDISCQLGDIANGDTVKVTIVAEAVAAGTDANITFVGLDFGSPTHDPDPGNDFDLTPITVEEAPTAADLKVFKSGDFDIISLVGDTLTYQICVVNGGPDTARSVTVNDALPAGVTLLTAFADQGSCGAMGDTVSCDLGDIGENDTVKVSIKVTADETGPTINTACATSDTPDPNPDNNCDFETTFIFAGGFECNLFPRSDTNFVGESHVVTVSVTFDGEPERDVVNDVIIAFEVFKGPNMGDSGSGTTNINGLAMFTYTGDGGAGTDSIKASFPVDGIAIECFAEKVWVVQEPIFRVERSTGDVFAAGAFTPGGADLAERINVSEPVEPGDVVELDPNNPKHYRKARAKSQLIAGVITTEPGFILGNRSVVSGEWSETGVDVRPMLALLGKVPVKATTENGPIRPGDLLTISSKPSHAMLCPQAKGCEGDYRESTGRFRKRGGIDTGVGDVALGIVQLCKLTEGLSPAGWAVQVILCAKQMSSGCIRNTLPNICMHSD